MNSDFEENEELLRAVYPPEVYSFLWCNGRLSSAAFKDKKGLSVDRTFGRTIEESVGFIKSQKKGYIFSVSVKDCNKAETYLMFCPSKTDPYHSEIHASEDEIALRDQQALYLARHAVKLADP